MTYHHVDQTYFDLINDVLTNGVEKTDRTGTGTISVFGRQARYDLSLGFPILTSKRVHWKSVVGELLWFLQGNTNIKWLKENGISIWDEWADKDGNLGPVYGFSWRRWETTGDRVIEVARRPKESEGEYEYLRDLIDVSTISPPHDLLGKIYTSRSGAEYIVLDKISKLGEKNSKYNVQFLDNGFMTTARRPNLVRGEVENRYHKTVCGVGCLGEIEGFDERVYSLWRNMLARCYDHKHPSYQRYGARGVTVAREWKCFATFAKSLTQVPFYYKWIDSPTDYDLDKDYFGSNQYSQSTTIFLDSGYNQQLAVSGKTFSYKGKVYVSQNDCATEHGLSAKRISDVLSGKTVKGYSDFETVEPTPGFVFRKERVIDQIANLINEIKTNPDSRRLIVSAWNAPALPKMALAPCHTMFQFYVVNGKLSCQLYQRSCDLGLGQPFNVASYALLTHMIAQVCGLEVGDFVHTFGDLHIYSNHVEALKQQLHRTPYPMAHLLLDQKVTDIDEFTFDDIKIMNYQHHPAISLKVAI